MSRKVPKPTVDRGIVYGLSNIAAMMGVTTKTVQRWAQTEGFPLATLPNEVRVTSERLVDYWLLSRVPNKRSKKEGVAIAPAPATRDEKNSNATKTQQTHT